MVLLVKLIGHVRRIELVTYYLHGVHIWTYLTDLNLTICTNKNNLNEIPTKKLMSQLVISENILTVGFHFLANFLRIFKNLRK